MFYLIICKFYNIYCMKQKNVAENKKENIKKKKAIKKRNLIKTDKDINFE